MTTQEIEIFEDELKRNLNKVMQGMFKRWSDVITPEELRFRACAFLSRRCFEVGLEDLQKALRPSRQMARLTKLLEAQESKSTISDEANKHRLQVSG